MNESVPGSTSQPWRVRTQPLREKITLTGSSLVEVQEGAHILYMVAGKPDTSVLVAGSGGYGFVTKIADMVSNRKAGREFLSVEEGETPIQPFMYEDSPGNYVAADVLGEIDRKIDDGLPGSGRFQFSTYAGAGTPPVVGGTASGCTDADSAAGRWLERGGSDNCGAAILLR